MSANVIADEDRQGFKHQHTSLLMGVTRLQINKFIFSSFHSWLVMIESFFGSYLLNGILIPELYVEIFSIYKIMIN